MTTTGSAPSRHVGDNTKQPCRFTSEQYRWLIETGILTTDHRVELIKGEIRGMPPMGQHHRRSMNQLNRWLIRHEAGRYLVQDQVTIDLAEGFTPDPDFILLRYREDEYRGTPEPQSSDVLWAIEVADSSLHQDLGDKSKSYAAAGVPELWVVDLPNRQIHRFSQPSKEGYQTVEIVPEDEIIIPLTLPDLLMPVSEALPESGE